MENRTKKCSGPCGLIKELDGFHKGTGQFGRKAICKICRKQERREFYLKNKSHEDKRNNQYRLNNLEQERKRTRYYNKLHKDERTSYNKKHIEDNKEYYLNYSRAYYTKNKDKILKRTKAYQKIFRQDPKNRIAGNIRNRIRDAIKNGFKSGSAISDLGCSLDKLKQHLEQKFYPNPETGEIMSWNNYGLYGWHIDHIIPLSSFDLTNREQFLKACHYTNLQPLWAKENIRKGAKL